MIKKTIAIAAIISVFIAAGILFFISRPEGDDSFNYDPGEYFVTDIKDTTRLLKTDIIIQAKDKSHNDEWTAENHRIRDIIIFILRSKTHAQLQSDDIFRNLNKEIIEALNKEFKTSSFERIYFNEFVIQ